jgi:hypothetical protein
VPPGRWGGSEPRRRSCEHSLRASIPDDQVALEATINTFAIAKLLEGDVGRVVVSNPMRTRTIADAKMTTDKVNAGVLARLLAAD